MFPTSAGLSLCEPSGVCSPGVCQEGAAKELWGRRCPGRVRCAAGTADICASVHIRVPGVQLAHKADTCGEQVMASREFSITSRKLAVEERNKNKCHFREAKSGLACQSMETLASNQPLPSRSRGMQGSPASPLWPGQ